MKHLPFNRNERVADEIQKVVATFFYTDCFDDRVKGINITGIRLTRDLRLAYIYYFINGDEEKKTACEKALTELRGEIRHQISGEITLKYVPELKFFFDESIDRGGRIDELLSKIGRG